MKTKVSLILVGLYLFLIGCQPQFGGLLERMVEGTLAAGLTKTASIDQAVSQKLTQLASQPSETSLPQTNISTAAPTNTESIQPSASPTEIPSSTPEPTSTLEPTSTSIRYATATGVISQGDVCAQKGCHKITFKNKTNLNATISLSGPGNYYYVVPPGTWVFEVLPGRYYMILDIPACTGKGEISHIEFYHTLNAKWYFDIKCKY